MTGQQFLALLDLFTKIMTAYLAAIGTYFTIKSIRTRHHPQFYFSSPRQIAPGKWWSEFAAIKRDQRYHTYEDLNLLVQGQNPEMAIIRVLRNVTLNGVKVRRFVDG